MTKEDYEELSECLVFLQLSLLDKRGKLGAPGFAELANLRFEGWNEKRTDKAIRKFMGEFIDKFGDMNDD